MRVLKNEDIEQVAGGLTPEHGAALEIALAGIALVCSGGVLALAAVGAAAICYQIGDS